MITCAPRTGPLRCALCHDALGGAAPLACRACGAAHHPACSRIPARCATCSARLVVRWRPTETRRLGRQAAAFAGAVATFGLALGALHATRPARAAPARAVLGGVALSREYLDPATRPEAHAPDPCCPPDDLLSLPLNGMGWHCGPCTPDCMYEGRRHLPNWRATSDHDAGLLALYDAWHGLASRLPTRPRGPDDVELARLILRSFALTGQSHESAHRPAWRSLARRSLECVLESRPPDEALPFDDLDRAALGRSPADQVERRCTPRTWREVALGATPGARLDPARPDVRRMLLTLIDSQRPDGTWNHVAEDPTHERPEIATAINALLLACVLFEPDGTLSPDRE